MDPATKILSHLADGRADPSMGSEYMDVRSFLARPGKVVRPPPHGSNDSDFGIERLVDKDV